MPCSEVMSAEEKFYLVLYHSIKCAQGQSIDGCGGRVCVNSRGSGLNANPWKD